jgi:maltooligosyltrehalose synthase
LHQEQAIVTVVPRLTAEFLGESSSLVEGSDPWQDSRLTVPSWKAGSDYINLLTGERFETVTENGKQTLRVGSLLRDCPVALLERRS